MRQPDIEIYLKDVDQDAVSAWLEQVFAMPCTWQARGQTFKCTLRYGGEPIPVTWLPKAVGKWHSLLFESDVSPWVDDLACARDAQAALQVQVRCAPSGWSEEEEDEAADRWLKVTDEGVEEIVWRTE
jgi:hypothetical protein